MTLPLLALLIALGIITLLFITRFILTNDQQDDSYHAGSWGMVMPVYPSGIFAAKTEALRAAYLSGARQAGYRMGRKGYENSVSVLAFYEQNDITAIQEYNAGYTEGYAAFLGNLAELAVSPA